MKYLILMLAFFVPQISLAQLAVNCEVSSHTSKYFYDVQMNLSFVHGSNNSDGVPVLARSLTIIEKQFSEKTRRVNQRLLFNEDLYYLDIDEATGLFNYYDHVIGSDAGKNDKEMTKARQLSLKIQEKAKDENNQPTEFSSMEFLIQNSPIFGGQFSGYGNLTYGGKTHKKLNFRCNVNIAMEYYDAITKE